MTINKQFAQDGGELDVCMDQLVEVLAQLLDEPIRARDQGVVTAITNLHSGDDRVIHVIENKPKK